MSKRRKASKPRKLNPLAVLVIAAAVSALGVLLFTRHRSPDANYHPRPRGSVSFNNDVAPIVYANCSGCHRPGESAPFSLISYEDVAKRTRQIAEVTQSRYMPPWLPEQGREPLLNERRLTVDQIGLINQWFTEGAKEGRRQDLPPLPKWTEGWQLGQPDLVVKMSDAFMMPAEGKDVYRNFIIPVPTTERRFVRALEFRPSSRAIHHAFIRVDRTHGSRALDAKDGQPGFSGMAIPASVEMPAGHFLGWQPGRGPLIAPSGLAWTLSAGADIVLLLHMQPRGKVESVQPTIGLYFTDMAPTNTPTKIALRSYAIDIPAGATNYTIEDSVTVPVDTDLLAVLPHAHYLAKTVEAFAIMPAGERKTLLRIPNWDFNWQSDFRFAKPIFLPKGATLGMHYTYDNSTNNLRNPHQPPQRVKYGLQTTDEMGELHFQMLAHHSQEQTRLEDAAYDHSLRDIVNLNQHLLRENPNDAEATIEIAKVSLIQRNFRGAETLLRRAITVQPLSADAHYSLGIVLMESGRLAEAEPEFLETIRIDPLHYKACNNAGLVCLRQGKLDQAEVYFSEALRLHPNDKLAQENLDLVVRTKRGK